LLREEDDLAGVVFDVAYDLGYSFENGSVTPGAVGLRVDHVQQVFGVEGGDDAGGFLEGVGEVGPRDDGCGGGLESEFVVAATDVRLVGDAVQYPLAHVAFEMQEEVGDGVFMVAAAGPELVF
jgi:hypothetical protein